MVGGMKKVTTHNNEDMLPQCIQYPQLYEEMKVCGPNGTKTRCEDRCMAAGLFNLISWLIYSRETLHFFISKVMSELMKIMVWLLYIHCGWENIIE